MAVLLLVTDEAAVHGSRRSWLSTGPKPLERAMPRLDLHAWVHGWF